MKLSLLVVLSVLSAVSWTSAATINFANGGGRGNVFLLSDGTTRVLAGSLIEVGFYSTAGDTSSAFTLFGTTTMGDPGTGVNAIGGHIPGAGKSFSSTLSDGNSTFEGKAFVLRVYNAASVGLATQIGIFNAPTLWTTPGAGGFNDSGDSFLMTVGASASPGLVGTVTALDPIGPTGAGTYAIGPVTVGTANNFGSVYTLAAIVPEPGTISMLGFLGFIAIGRRKR